MRVGKREFPRGGKEKKREGEKAREEGALATATETGGKAPWT